MTEIVTRAAYTVPIDHQKVRKDWASEGFSFGVFRDPPGQEWNDFVHQTDEYVVVAEGRLEMEVDALRLIAEPGDLVRIPKGAMHSLKTLSREGSVWLYGYGTWDENNG